MLTEAASQLSSFLRTTTVRLAALYSLGLGLACLLMFSFIYWQATAIETRRVDHILTRDALLMAAWPMAEIRQSVEERVTADFHRVVYASLFEPGGQLIVGNLHEYPQRLVANGQGQSITLSGCLAPARVVGRRLPDGATLVIGRNVDNLQDIEGVVMRALELGVIPAMLIALIGGAELGRRAQRRVRAISSATEQIGQGELRARLPLRGSGDEFDHLVGSINRMLDDVGRMFDQVKSTGENIAHDLRTPLTQIRTRLERACETAETYEELRELVDLAVERLDQSLQSMSALLRISQIEAHHRQARFAPLDLRPIVAAVADLYRPVAEEHGVAFTQSSAVVPLVRGDGDLLMEAIANLVDNAVKYTPAGGHVRLAVAWRERGPVILVEDDGIGIAPDDKAAIMSRHFRGGRTLSIKGHGLGLALVDAVVRLHGFSLSVTDNHPGSTFTIACAAAETRTPSPPDPAI